MRKSDSNGTVSAVTMFEGCLVFVTDNPSKAVSWFHEVMYVTGWIQGQECCRLQ